jgi:hypothetical protein
MADIKLRFKRARMVGGQYFDIGSQGRFDEATARQLIAMQAAEIPEPDVAGPPPDLSAPASAPAQAEKPAAKAKKA